MIRIRKKIFHKNFNRRDDEMEIITMVKGQIPEESEQAFEQAYADIKKEPVPEGLIASYLLKDMIEPNMYIVETVWASQEALKKIMEEDTLSSDVELFEKFKVNAVVDVHQVRDNFPQYED